MIVLRKSLKALISVFIVLNLFTTFYVNRPDGFDLKFYSTVLKKIPRKMASRIQRMGKLTERYSELTGLWSRWNMFGRISKSDWKFFSLWAVTEDGAGVLLSLPKQGERTFWQRNFSDFRESKFHNNLYGNVWAQWRYARHLCRRYPEWDGKRVKEIHFVAETQGIRDPLEAGRQGGHLIDPRSSWTQKSFACAAGEP